MKRKAEDVGGQARGGRGSLLQFFAGRHSLKRIEQRRQRDGQLDMLREPAQVLERVRHTLQEMRFAFIEAAESVGAQGLEDANVDKGVVVLHERVALEANETAEAVKVVVEELL